MATGTTIAALPFRIQPLNNIVGATYRSGSTHAQILERLRVYINDVLRAEVNEGFEYLLVELNKGIENAETVVLEAKAGWETAFNAYMLDVNASLMALNDHAMATLIDDPATETGTALVNGFIPRVPETLVYVDPVNGHDNNAGEIDQPLRSVKAAIRLAEAGAQNADTNYTIQLAAGIYAERVTASVHTPYRLNVTIQGPAVGHPGIPTVLFTEGSSGVGAAAFKFENPNASFTLKYIRGLGYNGTSSSAFINSTHGHISTVNVHAENCFFGVSSIRGNLVVDGGVFHNNGRLANGTGTGAAVRSLMLNRHTIGKQDIGNYTAGPRFTGNRYAVQVQESSVGHIEYAEFEDNESAIVLRANARANISGSKFARNQTDVMADSNSHVFGSGVFASGVDRSDQTVVLTSGSRATSSQVFEGASPSLSRSLDAVNGDYAAQTITGTTATTAILSKTLVGPWWNDKPRVTGAPPKRVRIRAVGTISGALGTVQFVLKMADRTQPVTFNATETGAFVYEGSVVFADSGRQILESELTRNLAETPRYAVTTTAQDMSVNQPLTLSVTLANAADSVTIEYVELYSG